MSALLRSCAAVLAACLSLALAGCGPEGESSKTKSEAPAAAPAKTAAPAAAPAAAPVAEAKPLVVTAQGVGGITAATAFTAEAIGAALPGLQVKTATGASEGQSFKLFQAQRGGTTVVTLLGTDGGKVTRAVVADASVTGPGNTRVGQVLSNVYGDSGMPKCVAGQEESSGKVLCPAPGASNVMLVFAGAWNGPDGQLPPGDVLAKWTVQSIVWLAR